MRLPLFVDVTDKLVVLIGGGRVAADKGIAFADAGARLRVIAPEIQPHLALRAIEVRERQFEPSDLAGAWLVVAAAPTEVNRQARAAADAQHTFVISVDDPANCTAFGAARLERGGITIALSSDGHAPALVSLLRRAIDAILPDDLDVWSRLAATERRAWRENGVPFAKRTPLLLRALNDLQHRGAL